ncbi:sugar transferase [Parablautia muri]|uniref:Sugar transferase n=1 Tax=Parablautia muri TaxID=2320879 RepID=A0A9X5BDH6_9FIRM|nr:sugar transferase [Parablautia muri]NBJ91724.1 sugar transferase [Parablautia muri]
MYQRKSRLQSLIILMLDCICITVSLILANYIRNGRLFVSDNARMDFGMLLGASLTVFLAMNLFRNTNRDIFLRGPLHEVVHIIQNNILMFAGAATILYFLNLIDAYSRLAFMYFLLLDCGLMFLLHQLWKKILPFLYVHFGQTRKLLMVADEEYAAALIQDMKGMKDFRYEITGIVLVGMEDRLEKLEDVEVVTDEEHLVEYCKGASLDEIIVAVGAGKKKSILPKMELMSEMGITIHYQIPVPELSGARQKVLSQFGRFYTVTYANRVAPVGQIILKRLLDLCGAMAGCIVLLLLTVVAGPLIKLESPGPVFFAQKRVGRNGRIFNMYKFRSMYADAEERKKELMSQNEMSGLMFKIENDPRITKIGRFMRRTSLDEFPQFLNILKGDMSLVGTRPPTLDEFAQYSPYHKKRLSFRPGLTGMWQVSGRSDITDFEEIVKLDVEYIDNWSFMLDVKILFKTALAVFQGKGAK